MEKAMLDGKIAEASKTIFNYCLGKTHDRDEAEDLSQEILLELLKSSQNIRDEKAFYGFMWAVAGNVYKQWCRKRQQNRTCELTEVSAATEDVYFDDENEDNYLLRRELSLLSQKYRRATILYYIERKSCAEIAQLLLISESMVKYLLFKARTILKEGMNMERNLGQLSYNPKSLIPMYNGSGPNRFSDFMNHKIRQNIVSACYNDALTVQQISLETGIPLPYLDDEIAELVKYRILNQDGKHYQSNVIVISADCTEEINRAVAKYQERIADKLESFLKNDLQAFKAIGFVGSDFSENTLRWQMLSLINIMIILYNTPVIENNDATCFPETGWGDHALLWLVEDGCTASYLCNFSQMDGKHGDRLQFADYIPKPKGEHHDFYGNERYTDIFLDIVRGNTSHLSEYDLDSVADMIKKGYVCKEDNGFRALVPVYTAEQYRKAVELFDEMIKAELSDTLAEMDRTAERIMCEHTPKFLHDQIPSIASMDRFGNAVGIPLRLLLDRGVLHTDWHPLEMPTTFAVLHD